MARAKIFISYSHHDDQHLDQLKKFLTPLERNGLIDWWADTRLEGGDDWQAEIDRALDEASVALLLVSQDFLASDYITRRELPILLARAHAGDVTLLSVFLRPSAVKTTKYEFTDRASGELRRVKLTKYQGYGEPGRALMERPKPERDRIYSELADFLERRSRGQSGSATQPTPRRTADRALAPVSAHEGYPLTIELERVADRLELRYSLPGRDPFEAATLDWKHVQPRLEPLLAVLDEASSGGQRLCAEALQHGAVLFDILFPGEKWRPVLRKVLNQPEPAAQPTPVRGKVLLRIATGDPQLLGLPWRLLAWQGRCLAEEDRLEVSVGHYADPRMEVTTTAPSQVLVLAPESAEAAGPRPGHYEAIREVLGSVWSREEAGYLRRVRNRRELENALRVDRPHLLYVYARSCLQGGRWCVVLDGSGSKPDHLALSELRQLCTRAGHWPAALYLNTAGLAGTPQPDPGQLLGDHVPLVLWRRLPGWTPTTEEAALKWLRGWLAGAPSPVAAWHQVSRSAGPHDPEAASIVLHASYRSWRTAGIADSSVRGELVRLRLDRDHQKALISKHIAELADSDQHRVMAVIGYGDSGGAVAHLSDQLIAYLEQDRADRLDLNRVRLEFPVNREGDLGQRLEDELCLQLGDGEGRTSLAQLLRQRAPSYRGDGKRPILWLDWGTFGADAAQPPLTPPQLRYWLQLCSGLLIQHCPHHLRLVSLVSLEVATGNQKRLEKALEGWQSEAWYTQPGFWCSPLPALAAVTPHDLLTFLRHGKSTRCPQNIQVEVAQRLIRETGGAFDRTVTMIEEAEQGSWLGLLDRLRRQQGVVLEEEDEAPF